MSQEQKGGQNDWKLVKENNENMEDKERESIEARSYRLGLEGIL